MVAVLGFNITELGPTVAVYPPRTHAVEHASDVGQVPESEEYEIPEPVCKWKGVSAGVGAGVGVGVDV